MISPLDWGESNLATGETMLFAQRMLETGLRRRNEEDEGKRSWQLMTVGVGPFPLHSR